MSTHARQSSAGGSYTFTDLHLTRYLPYLAIAALYVCSVLLVDPRGEFPLNDDWSYTRSAFKFGTEGKMQVDEWSAPTLVGQALYGGLLVRIFGPGFLLLRFSTLIASCLTACLLWGVLRRAVVPAGQTWIAVLAWIFNPVWFSLSFTYMTEIPFLLFVTLALSLYGLYAASGKLWFLPLSGASLAYAFLIRQTSVLFILPMLAALIFSESRRAPGSRIMRVLLWAGPGATFIAGYSFWLQQHGGSTPAAQRKFELLARIAPAQIIGNSFGMLFYLSFFLLPLVIFLTPRLLRLCREVGNKAWVAVAVWILISGCGLWWFHIRYANVPYLPSRPFHARMPYLLNVLYDTGTGPVTLDPTYYGQTPTPTHPHIWLAVTILCGCGVVVLGLLPTLSVSRFFRQEMDSGRKGLALFSVLSFLSVAAFEVVFSHTQEGGLFDRHILTAALPLVTFICLLGNKAPSRQTECRDHPGLPAGKSQIAGLILAGLVLTGLAWFSITSTHDYLSWNRLRWELGNGLLASNVDPLRVSGGFEFNGWHNYDTYRARGNISKIYYWWYDRPDYLITMEPQEAYHVLRKEQYFSWLHRRYLSVYLLERDTQE